MFNLDNSINNWLKSFHKHKAFNTAAVQEMEQHLRDHIEDLVADGLDERTSFEIATKDFGEVPSMAEEEYSNIKRSTSIKSIVFATMLNNYFKTSLRSMMKNPTSSFINVFGLAVAIGICLVVYIFYKFDYSLDQFHEHKDKVYVATHFVNRDGVKDQYGTTPLPLGDMIRQDFANVQSVCRVKDQNVVVKFEDQVFHERVRHVDPAFLDMFTFPLKWGFKTSLKDINSIILSEEMSIKYFGEDNPLGESISVIFDKGKRKTFEITGVAEKFPKAHIIDFDFLVHFENFQVSNSKLSSTDWKETVNATLVQVEDPSELSFIQQKMDNYRALQNVADKNWPISSFEFISIADLHLKSANIKNGISNDYNVEARLGLPIIGIFMLILACFNYINIAIVSAAKRLHEIGLRKVIGANRGMVITQFLAENVFITSFALLLGILLSVLIFIPWFSNLSGDALEFSLIDVNLWVFLIAILFVTGIASGMYPAFYISRFESVQIFKGTVKFGKKNLLTKLFLGVQLIMTCASITCAVVFVQNNVFQNERSWGYNQFQTQYVEVPDFSTFSQLKAIMLQDPNVLSVSGTEDHFGKGVSNLVLHLPDRQYEVRQMAVDANYLETMGLELAEGRFFKEDYKSDRKSIIVNEQLIESFGLKQSIGSTFKIDSISYEVVGVIRDFHLYSFYDKIQPIVFTVSNNENIQYLSLKVRDGSQIKIHESLQAQWTNIFPEIPFNGGHQSDVWGSYFELLNTAEKFYKVIASLAVMLASLGLYGLVSLNVAGRNKEFSVRKTLGASVKDLALSIVKQYAVLCTVSLVIGIPFSYMLAKASLDMLYAYPFPMSYWSIVLSGSILLMVLVCVVFTQVRQVSRFNPVDGLRVE